MKYVLKMRNPVSGGIEHYTVKIVNSATLPTIIDLWQNGAGYEIISITQATAWYNFRKRHALVTTADQSM